MKIAVLCVWLARRIAPAALVLAVGAGAAAQPVVNQQAQAVKEFADRVRAYLELRNRLAKELPAFPHAATPEQIRQHQEQLAAAVRRARQGAKQGDIFTPPVVPQFRTIIRSDLRARETRDAVAAMQEVPHTRALRVNDRWPADAPIATVPPRMLSNLHPLPEGLQYRFLGRHLVLLDGEADLVVDFITNVVPSVVRGSK